MTRTSIELSSISTLDPRPSEINLHEALDPLCSATLKFSWVSVLTGVTKGKADRAIVLMIIYWKNRDKVLPRSAKDNVVIAYFKIATKGWTDI